MSDFSIIEYLGSSTKEKCGYCKQENGSNSTGFWAHSLNVQDYQSLINRNWRRSGQYCYLPSNNDTCCPAYTIKCDASSFKLNKSHKKILKKMKKFLKDGIKEKNHERHQSMNSAEMETKPSQEHSEVNLTDINFSSIEQDGKSSVVKSKVPSKTEVPHKSTMQSMTSTASSDKPSNPKKAKLIRLERKKEKLAAKGLTLADVKPKAPKNQEKSLEKLLAEEPIDGKHRLKTKLVSVSAAESTNINLSFSLFCKYEHTIHKETHEFTDYAQFLVTSPLKLLKNQSSPSIGYGSFHQQYYLDDKLIAVGVVDILPQCLSSVYFYYDPDYSFLSLGTYATLREIALTRELSKVCPELHNYYLGFYIPTCPKMRYKANVKPSYLLCPEVFTWHLLDENMSREVDAVHYKRMNMEQEDSDKVTKDDLRNCLVLANRSAMKYGDFKRLASLPHQFRDDGDEMMEYASKVGKSLSHRLLIFKF